MERAQPLTAKQVLIVDAQPIVREGLKHLIASQPDMAVCGEASRISEAIACIEKNVVNLAIVEIRLDGRSGFELIKQLRSSGHKFPILVFSGYDDANFTRRSLAAGAQGYLAKNEPAAQIIEAMHRLLDGDFFVSQRMASKIFRSIGKRREPVDPIGTLSDRELEVLEAIGRGFTTRQTSLRLHLSISTIETYKSRIKTKLGLHNASQLASYASVWLNQAPRA